MTINGDTRKAIQSCRGVRSAQETGRMYGCHRNTVLRIWGEIDQPWRFIDKAGEDDNRVLRAVYTHIHPALATDQDRALYDAIMGVIR